MPVLETDRLVIDEAFIEDAPFIFELLNSPNWLKHIGDRGITNLDDARYYIQHSLISSYQKHGFGLYKVSLKKDRSSIGICGLLQRDYLDHPDIGFATLPEYEGNGYTYEAAHAIIKHSMLVLGMPTILAITSPQNVRSQRLLSKLGLNKVDTMKLTESDEDTLLYSN